MEAIFNLVESHAVSLRTRTHLRYDQARFSEEESKLGLNGLLVRHGGVNEHKGVPAMLERLYELPEEWTLVQLTFAHDPASRFTSHTHPFKHPTPPELHITRFECGKHARKHPPYCITIPIKQKFRTLKAELRTIIDDHQNRLKWGLLTNEQYYRFKGTLDMRMKNVVTRLQNDWLGHWISLLVAHYTEPENEDQVASFVDQLLDEYVQNEDTSLQKEQHSVTTWSRRNMYLLAKASAFLPEWELRKGVADCLKIPVAATKNLTQQLSKLPDAVRLRTTRRHPVILLLDEELELFPWEMLTVIQDHPVCRVPNLHILYALYKAHEDNISGGRLQVDAEFGYYIVNPEQNLPRNERRLRPFLTSRAPSWKGTFGVLPSSEQFRDVLQNYSIFIYAGHGSGSQFLQGDEIQKVKVQAVTFLFGCSSVTSKDLGGQVEPAGMWHFYHIASCPMVIGNLWAVTDAASDAITVHTLHTWLPRTLEMVADEEQERVPPKPNDIRDPDAPELWYPYGYKWKQEPDLLYAIHRGHASNKHYMASAALVARGLPVVIKGKVDKSMTVQHQEQESLINLK
ncbi:separin isoform X2 [Zootermopsis nevadensis]|nr:separin isoform X2 [Zootermopsis nevadensis]XP_021934506.1 separin isoform X2 [Zootermopsis nevadensis]